MSGNTLHTAKMQVQAFFKKAAAPAKKAVGKAAGKKATTVVKPTRGGAKVTKGWLGGQGGAANLDKWYGKQRAPSSTLDRATLAMVSRQRSRQMNSVSQHLLLVQQLCV